MGIILYSPAFVTESETDYWNNPEIYIMTMDDYRHWRDSNPQCKNVACFLPINVQLALAYRQYYAQNFMLVKPEQGKTKKAPFQTLVCEPLTDIELFYLFNYHGSKLPQYSSKKISDFVSNVHKARYYLAQNSLKKTSGKISTMFNIADVYDNRYLQNDLELPLDRDQDYNIYFACNRIRREIDDELSCFRSELFIASHGETVGRFFHITEAPKQTETRLNTQTRLNLIEHTFNSTVRGTFVNLPSNFRNRFIMPEGGHLGHRQKSPEKPKLPSVIMNSSILDITSPARPKPVYQIKTKTKILNIDDTYKSNFGVLGQNQKGSDLDKQKQAEPIAQEKIGQPNKPSSPVSPKKSKQSSRLTSNPDNFSEKSLNIKLEPAKSDSSKSSDKSGSSPNLYPNKSPKITENQPKTDSISNPNKPLGTKNDNTPTNPNSKDSSESITLEFTSSNDSTSNKENIIVQNVEKSDPKVTQPVAKPSPKIRTDFITELIRPRVINKSSDDNSNATTYSDMFPQEHITFDLEAENRNLPGPSNKNPIDYNSMHNLSEEMKNMQINFKDQLDLLLEDYRKITIDPNNKIVPDPSLNVAFLNDINQLIVAIDQNKHKAVDIRQHVLETISNIINRYFRNPSGPLDPSKINVDDVNPNNFIQRSALAYLDNIRDNIMQIKPPLTQAQSSTPFADKQIVKITNEFYENIEPLVKCISEQFEEAKLAIEKTVTETNLGPSKQLVPTNLNPKPKPNLPLTTRRSSRLQQQKLAKVARDNSNLAEDEFDTKNLPIKDLSSTVKREKRPHNIRSLPTTPKSKPPPQNKTEPINRKTKVRFNFKTDSPRKAISDKNKKRTVKPDVPDSLYALCDPTMPALEEIEENKTKTIKRKGRKNSSSDSDSPKIIPKKSKSDKPRYVISDTEEEV